jgi:hypothetical protein
MSNVLSFYFDGSIIQAVKVRLAGNSVEIKYALTLQLEEFYDYLSNCKEKSCIICCNPPIFYQDTVHLPPAAGKFYDKLVGNEIRNAHPDLTSFSFFHNIIGESSIEGKPHCKIAVFSYPDNFLSDLIHQISHFGIKVSCIFAAPYSIFRLALTTCSPDFWQPRIFIANLPGEKLHLVSENSELAFIRKTPSLDNNLLPEDINNINMTLDYCIQSLRLRPIQTVYLNPASLAGHFLPPVSVPFREELPPQLADTPSDIIQNYLAPIASALHSVESPNIANILPSDYASSILHRKLLTTATLIIVAIIMVLAMLLVNEQLAINELKTEAGRMRTELSGSANELATFRKLDSDVTQLKQPLELVKIHNSSLNPAVALAELNLPQSGDYIIKAVTIQNGEGGLNLQIEGAIISSAYSATQGNYEKLVALIGALPGYAVLSGKVDIKQKNFSIQARYNGGRRGP